MHRYKTPPKLDIKKLIYIYGSHYNTSGRQSDNDINEKYDKTNKQKGMQSETHIRHNFFLLVDLREKKSDSGLGGVGGMKKSSGHFQSFFFSFSELLKVKQVRVNQQSVSNLKMFHNGQNNHFNSVTLKITQTEPQKGIIISTKQIIFRVGGQNEKNNFRFFFLLSGILQ